MQKHPESGKVVMLELEPIEKNGQGYQACGHIRDASEAFNSEYSHTAINMPYNNNVDRPAKRKKKSITGGASISGRQIIAWLGGATLMLALAISFKGIYSDDSHKTNRITITLK